MPSIEWLTKQFVLLRMTPDEVRGHLLEGGLDADLVDKAYEEFKKLTGSRRYLTPPAMLVKSDAREGGWYPGADSYRNAKYWPALREYLLNTKFWTEDAVQSIHRSSDKIVSWLESPYEKEIQTRGMVVGYIQSGKTANFTAVIAKAADAGYRFFIVLSGTKKSLRKQTQTRLEQELIALNDEFWFSPTTYSDFRQPNENANFFLSNEKHDKVLCVIKKNKAILQRMIAWLKTGSRPVLANCPFLIIDDEADEASINTARGQANGVEGEIERTKINKLVVDMMKLLPKAAYIGYTATPFANCFIDPSSPDDLYPKDFIVALPKPLGHFGTEEIFGRHRLLDDDTEEEFIGLDVIRNVPDDEADKLRPKRKSDPFNPEITPSLEKALRYFFMACAARTARGQREMFSTMLVHTSQLISAHNEMRQVIEDYLNRIKYILKKDEADIFDTELRIQWEDEQKKLISKSLDMEPIKFDELRPYFAETLERIEVVADNSNSPKRLDYSIPGRIQIAVGGNTLSRGLTLEGLIVSYFVRSARTYDTLLQMGRWFGYRPGYADLPRIWMTSELRGDFYDLATVEAEMRRDIEQYDKTGVTPKQYGLRIQTHPNLGITAPLKMQHAVFAMVRYEKTEQTVLFDKNNKNWLEKNIMAADWLVRKALENQINSDEVEGNILFHNVPVQLIMNFLNFYQFHPNNRALNSKLLIEHIQEQNKYKSLLSWNVVIRGIKGDRGGERETIEIGGIEVPLVYRARRSVPSEYANIGVLMSKGDIGSDLKLTRKERSKMDAEALFDAREKECPNDGLMIIYPISKNSTPTTKSEYRVPLQAEAHVIGLGFVFPEAKGELTVGTSYVTVNPELLEQPEFESDEDEEEIEE